MLGNLFSQCLGSCWGKLDVCRSLDFLELRFAESVKVIDHDPFSLHDLGGDGIVFV